MTLCAIFCTFSHNIFFFSECRREGWNGYFAPACYKVHSRFEYFERAQEICGHDNGKLTVLLDPRSNNFVQRLIQNLTRTQEVWIGLKRTGNEFVWVNDSKISGYSNWALQRPSLEGDCVQMLKNGQWNNILCYQRMQFVCQRGELKNYCDVSIKHPV